MKFTFSWLKEHLRTDASAKEVAHALTMLGLEVEGLTDRGKALEPFRIAKVLEAVPHPQADRLRVCKVSVGRGEPLQIVCGAPNARTGMKGVFAAVGHDDPRHGASSEADQNPRRRLERDALLRARDGSLAGT